MMNPDTCVSIVVAIYKVEKYLNRCVDSLIHQTYQNLEIILVNDGSLDSCGEICDEFALKDPRVKVIHKENEGANNARYDGVYFAHGKYIMIIDGDDYLDLDYVRQLVENAEETQADLVVSGYIEDFGQKQILHKMNIATGFYSGDVLEILKSKSLFTGDYYEFGINPALWNKLFLREKLIHVLYKDDTRSIRIGEDTLISFPYIMSCDCISIIQTDQSYHYMQHGASMLRTFQPKIIENVSKVKKHLESFEWSNSVSNQINYYCSWLLIYAFHNQLNKTMNPLKQSQAIQDIYSIDDINEVLDFIDYSIIPNQYRGILENLQKRRILSLQLKYGIPFYIKKVMKRLLKK